MNSVTFSGLTKGQGKMIPLCFGGKITRLPLKVLPSAQQPQPHSQENGKNTLGGQDPVPGLVPRHSHSPLPPATNREEAVAPPGCSCSASSLLSL